MATAPRQTKRPFQPSITSYFGRSERASQSAPRSGPQSSSLSPSLPATIQSSLLNVGMRVRKSVPEGYKTASYCTPGRFNQLDRPYTVPTMEASPNNNHRGGFAELTPYCGILRVGGYTSQPLPLTTDDIEPFQVGDDDYDFQSSQESTISTISSGLSVTTPSQAKTRSKKRRFEDGDIFADISVWEDEDGIPASARFLALPKTRRKWLRSTSRKVEVGQEQENMWNDFEEADFLQAPDVIEEEMDMVGS